MVSHVISKHRHSIAVFFALVSYLTMVSPAIAWAATDREPVRLHFSPAVVPGTKATLPTIIPPPHEVVKITPQPKAKKRVEDMGGPSQPEMSSFQSVGTDKMVNLFNGDFNYSVPLLDVGGYPVNIFYEGGISPEQEASWVGLGWNINPGNINRNMRGIPDDFNGKDTLKQMQMMKPNNTFGVTVGGDLEVFGKKGAVNAELGVALNNYLGPSLDLSVRGNLTKAAGKAAGSEKSANGPSANLNLGLNINSRAGTTFSINATLNGRVQGQNNALTMGIGASTAYNSRSGIKAVQISEQVSYNSTVTKQGEKRKTHETYTYLKGGGKNTTIYSSSISFLKPSYLPSIRMPLTNTAWSGRFQLGLGSYGFATDIEAEVYQQKSEIAKEDTVQLKPMVGYLYYQYAQGNAGWIMDFTRFNDKEVTPNTPVISIPQYSYDVFTIQGEGTGGSIRAYRNDLGYVRDNLTISKDKSIGAGADLSPPGHYGGNINLIKTPTSIGEWKAGNRLRTGLSFGYAANSFENVYFRNPGENCVIDSNRLAKLGGGDLVRFTVGGSAVSPTAEPALESISALGVVNKVVPSLLPKPSSDSIRNKRSQVVNFLTAEEASKVGLEKVLKSYDNVQIFDNAADTLIYESIPRVDNTLRKAHHISQINVTEGNGKRYIYGVPVYNIYQKDFTFSVDNSYSSIPEKIPVTDTNYLKSTSKQVGSGSDRDGYVQVTTTPGYAHSFLLSGILSPDYVDLTNNGISEDDIGDAIKFNYTRIKKGSSTYHQWRAPLTVDTSANFNPGSRSEVADDKGMITYGVRESWYLHSIESKNMIAIFYTSNRRDGKGTKGVYGGVDTTDTFKKKLDSIALFSKADLRINGLAQAKPIKTVHFVYSYFLAKGTPDNKATHVDSLGKLTLQNIYFTYNGKNRASKNMYGFTYYSPGADSAKTNPAYSPIAATDRWGTYKPWTMNPGGLKNADYPYSIQDSAVKKDLDLNASAWMLRKIVLPSGGQIEVQYESDDYAYVQDKRAAIMMNIVGFGNTNAYASRSAYLYPYTYPTPTENDYVFIKVPVACTSSNDVYRLYLQGLSQLSFKLWVNMPKGPEYVPCYAQLDGNNYGVVPGNSTVIWVKLKRIGGFGALSLTALEYLRQQLPKQAFAGYEIQDGTTIDQVAEMLKGMFKSLRDAFKDPINAMRTDNKAMKTDLTKCFVRLNDPDGFKYGGGYRVKSVVLTDNWKRMTGQDSAKYGQSYDYTTIENYGGVNRKISSGVASYEPTIGGEENPFQNIILVEDYLPAGPTSYGAVEMPAMDAFFPAPSVGYSKVTVTAIKFDTVSTKKSRSGIGRQVTEFYTAKDYPLSYSYSTFDPKSKKEFHQASLLSFMNKTSFDYKALSQGFLITTNDMHGKMKSQSSFAENDTTNRISYTEYFYKNTGKNGLNDRFSFIDNTNKGTVFQGNMGIDVDLMTDTREFSVISTSLDLQGQFDWFYFPIGAFPIFTIWPVSGLSENIYRAITTTKTINYHGVLDSIVSFDKGSQVSTKNLAYDANTGDVLVTRTNNEFNKPIYATNYPAYWAYPGMGLAYSNIDASFSGISMSDGKITSAGVDMTQFESGDEILVVDKGLTLTSCDNLLYKTTPARIWAVDKNRNNTSLKTTADFIFLDSAGYPVSLNTAKMRIIRSGRRNQLDQKIASVTSVDNPLSTGKLSFPTGSNVLSATAIDFKEKWTVDNDVFRRYKVTKDTINCVYNENLDSTGVLESHINPYTRGIIGNYRPFKTYVFYDGRKQTDVNDSTNIAKYGYLNNFKLYWDYNTGGSMVPDTVSTQWIWSNKLNLANSKGLELETADALGIATSAQYGFNKTIPVAVTKNAKYGEMFAEGFEDYEYKESVDATVFNFFTRHVDFSKLANSAIINTDTTAFKAHTGKYVFKLNSDSAVISFNTSKPTDTITPPKVVFPKDTVRQLTNLGGNYTYVPNAPVNVPTGNRGTATFATANPGFNLNINPLDTFTSTRKYHQYSQNGYFYINVPSSGTYYFNTTLNSFYDNSGVTVNYRSNGLTVSIYDTLDNLASTYSIGQNDFSLLSGSYSAKLCAGVYVVRYSVTEIYTVTGTTNLSVATNTVAWSCTNSTSSDYKDLVKTPTCVFTKPIAAAESMKNPLFTVPVGKKMLISAWVMENCGNAANGIPCKSYTYTQNQIQIRYGNSSETVMLSPAGPIIDGWQRYEGVFTAPTAATSVIVKLISSSTQPIYFDDIRIHPYNSNMAGYVYDPVSLRLVAELDANNYARFYEYDEEGVLVRTKVETQEGVKTVTETRSALQKVIQ